MTTQSAHSAQPGIDRLYDYTKFHVGLYASLVFGVVALVGIADGQALRHGVVLAFAIVAVASWVLSGFAGGVILGKLVELEGGLTDFQEKECGPGTSDWMPGRSWENLEHRSFWIGVAAALVAFGIAVGLILSGL